DLELVEDLAARAALALDNARLFREAQEQANHQAELNAALRATIDERDRAVADLQVALRTRDEFLASASHDLKNPIASIKATAQLLQHRMRRTAVLDPALVERSLARIDAVATRAAGLVDELLDVARLQMGRPLDLDRHEIDLVDLTRGIVGEQQRTDRHEIVLEPQANALSGWWDRPRLQRALANLLDNAVKYSPDGGAIRVRL